MASIVNLMIELLEIIFFFVAGLAFLVTIIFFYGFSVHLRKKKKRKQKQNYL
jgi:hypothetical protein